jgi:riboflavin kinase/FMN adenylyltransferase
MNFGIKPTIGADLEPIYEIHILNFNQEIYGKKISFELLDFIREEKKFESLDALKQQVKMDIDKIKNC